MTGRQKGEKVKYENNLTEVGTFHSIETFWAVFNNVLSPSALLLNANLHLFKKGIKPMWEDAANQNGGKWTISLGKSDPKLDKFWRELLLGLTGGVLDKPGEDEFVGIVASRRKNGDRVAVWNRRKENDIVMDLGRRLRKHLGADPTVPFEYQHHQDSLKSGASYANQAKVRV